MKNCADEELKTLLRTYKRMDRKTRRKLEEMGIRVTETKNHIKLYAGNEIFICCKTPSDHRSSKNLASMVCKAVERGKQ